MIKFVHLKKKIKKSLDLKLTPTDRVKIAGKNKRYSSLEMKLLKLEKNF